MKAVFREGRVSSNKEAFAPPPPAEDLPSLGDVSNGSKPSVPQQAPPGVCLRDRVGGGNKAPVPRLTLRGGLLGLDARGSSSTKQSTSAVFPPERPALSKPGAEPGGFQQNSAVAWRHTGQIRRPAEQKGAILPGGEQAPGVTLGESLLARTLGDIPACAPRYWMSRGTLVKNPELMDVPVGDTPPMHDAMQRTSESIFRIAGEALSGNRFPKKALNPQKMTPLVLPTPVSGVGADTVSDQISLDALASAHASIKEIQETTDMPEFLRRWEMRRLVATPPDPPSDTPAPRTLTSIRVPMAMLRAGLASDLDVTFDPSDPGEIAETFQALARQVERHLLPDSAWDTLFHKVSSVLDVMTGMPFVGGAPWRGVVNPFRGWNGARFSLCEFIQQCVCKKGRIPQGVFARQKSTMFRFLDHLFNVSTASKLLGTVSPDPGEAYYSAPESLTVAARNLRLQAITALIGFMFRVEESSAADRSALLPRTRHLIEGFLDRETNPAPMHPFGRHFRDFYASDPSWSRTLISRIFPADPLRRLVYVGGWTGFLSRFPVREMFVDPDVRALYFRGLELGTDPAEHLNPAFYHDPEQGIANHLAIAHFELQVLDRADELLASFLEKSSPSQMARFVACGGDIIPKNWVPKTKETWDRVRSLWEWTLENRADHETLVEFGAWLDVDPKAFPTADMAKLAHDTLARTSGEISGYSGLANSIHEFALADPARTLEVLDLFLHNPRVDKDARHTMLVHSDGWLKAARHLSSLPASRERAAPILSEIEECRRPPSQEAR